MSALPPIARCSVFFYYEDLPAAAQWYQRVLGCAPVVDLHWSLLLRFGDGVLFGMVDAVHGTLRPTANKGAMLALETPQLEGWLERIQRLDPAALVTRIEPGAQGLIERFLIRDPGGYMVEFFRWLADPEQLTAR